MVDYTSKRDLEILVNDLKITTKFEQRLEASILIFESGLFQSSFFINFLAKFKGWRWIFYNLRRIDEQFVNLTWNAILEHVVDGEDHTDKRSAGGFNSEELKKFTRILEYCGYKLPEGIN